MKTEEFDAGGRSRGWYSARNRLNDLTGREWVFSTRSVITKVYPPDLQHALRSRHGGQKPPRLCADLIRTFTKSGQWVLDPFMGVGGVLLGAALSGRRAVGVEWNPAWIDIYREVCRLEGLEAMEARAGDARLELEGLAERRFDLVFTDVPYWRMDRARRSQGTFKRVGEEAKPARGSRLNAFGGEEYAGKAEWLAAMGEVFRRAAGLLRERGYLVTFIGDMYYEGAYHCLSAELAGELARVGGLSWKANLIWYDVSKKLHLYGYQYAFIPSMIHQNILVFRKE